MPARRFACLIAQHPAINHAVILREVRLLRETFEIYTASIRAPDRPPAQLSPEERDEANRTYYVNPSGISGAAAALSATLLSRPMGFFRGLCYAIALAKLRPRQIALNLAYFVQATLIGRWMRGLGLKHLHTHYSSTVALLVHKTCGVEISISFHGSGEFDDPVGFWIREKVAACAFVRAISHYARSQLMRFSAAADWDKIHVVYTGVDPNALTPRPFRANPSPVEIICVGSLVPVKAQHILIEALARLRRQGEDVRLHIAGDGPDRAELERRSAALHLAEHVIFHGWTLHERLDALYRRADIFALASFAEGVPVVLMEAMAMEIPCVATWITGIPELIRDGLDGLLVAPSDMEGFAAAIRRLIIDAEQRRTIGAAGRTRILDRFDLRKNSASLGTLLGALIEPHSMKE